MKQFLIAVFLIVGLSQTASAQTFQQYMVKSGTSYPFTRLDCGRRFKFTSSSSVAASLPRAGNSSDQLPAGCNIEIYVAGTGTVTVTPTTSTIAGGASLSIVKGQHFTITSDGTNYDLTQRDLSDAERTTLESFNCSGGSCSIGSGSTTYFDVFNSAAPSTPSSGQSTLYVNSTSKTAKVIDDTGAESTTVRADTGASNNFLTAISANGVISKAQPAASNLSNGTTGSGAVALAGSPTFTTQITTPAILSGAADPADAGVLRMGNNEVIGWEASTPGTDRTLKVNTSDIFEFSHDVSVGSGADVTLGRVATNVGSIPWLQESSGQTFLSSDATSTSTSLGSTGLSITVVSGRKYTFRLVMFMADSTAGDGAKFDFNGGSATMTNFRVHCTAFDTSLQLTSQATSPSTAFTIGTLTGSSFIECSGSVEPSGNGTFIPRFAQNSHSSGTLTLARGSNLIFKDMP